MRDLENTCGSTLKAPVKSRMFEGLHVDVEDVRVLSQDTVTVEKSRVYFQEV
jgi:hypothetical protein